MNDESIGLSGPALAEAVRRTPVRQTGVRPLVTGRYPLAEAEEAFRVAGDRGAAVKVQLLPGETGETDSEP